MDSYVENKKLNKLTRLSAMLVSPPLCASFISLASIWFYLMRLGRQDLFMDFVSLKDVLGALSVFSLVSIFSLGFIFYIQTILVASLLTFSKSDPSHDKDNILYLKLLVMSSVTAVLLFYLSIFINRYLNIDLSFGIYAFINCILCVGIYLLSSKKSTSGNQVRQSFFVKYIRLTVIPFLIGFFSLFLVFPLSLIFKVIDFPEGTSDLKELVALVPLSLLITLITIIPAGMIISNIKKTSILRKIVTATSMGMLLLTVVSLYIPGLPLMSLNLTLKISGVVDYRPNYFSVPVDNYPIERFLDNSWGMRKSIDSKFLIFKGASFLSLGKVKLICPINMIETYEKSMRSRLFDAKYDSEMLSMLKKKAARCLVFRNDELSQWRSD